MTKIFKGSLLQLTSEGHLSLQIPALALMPDPTSPEPEMEEVPDSWVYVSDWEGVPASSRTGFLRFTKAGYLANAEALQNAYVQGVQRRWLHDHKITAIDIEKHKKDFHEFAMSFYANAKNKAKRLWLNAQKKADKLKKMYEDLDG